MSDRQRLVVLGNMRLFMGRVQLAGNEVPAFIEVMQLVERLEAEIRQFDEVDPVDDGE